MLPPKRFTVRNDPFSCEHCGKEVPSTSGSTPRNHCPFCLWSKHLDINPGDRANPCQGMMRPIGIYTHSKKSYVILHECERCGGRMKAKAMMMDGNAADDFDLLLALSGNQIEEEKKKRHSR